jgi:hypothetical protein
MTQRGKSNSLPVWFGTLSFGLGWLAGCSWGKSRGWLEGYSSARLGSLKATAWVLSKRFDGDRIR